MTKKLSDTQIEIVKLMAKGMKINTIAHRMKKSPNTVRVQRSQIYRRLGVRNATAAVATAIFEGYITKEDTLYHR